MIKQIAIVSVPVSDQIRARDFYTNVLGFVVKRDSPMSPDGARWIEVQPPGSYTTFTLVTWFETMKPGSMTGTVLLVDDLDATYAELQARGLELGPIQGAEWGRHAIFADLDGNGFILQEDPKF